MLDWSSLFFALPQDFAKTYRDLTPDNPAATNVAYGVNIGLFCFFSLM